MDDKSTSLREENLVPPGLRRFVPVIGGIIMGLALFGYLTGIRELASIERASPREGRRDGSHPSAVTYLEISKARLASNSSSPPTLSELKFDRPDLFATVMKSEAKKLEAIADRAQNRAYDGAPPTVPHPIDQISTASCLACHAEGIKVGDRVASRMSHSHLSNCTQCHASQHSDVVSDPTLDTNSTFVGAHRSGPGSRASVGAPPTIPHHTWMRENCSSCHGTLTREGTRSTHPWLTQCQQCHAPTAERDPSTFAGAWE